MLNGIKFDMDDWGHVSEEAQDLVRQLLTIDNEKRIGAADIINHKWMTKDIVPTILPNVQENIKKFKSKLRQVKNAIRAISIMQSLSKRH
jgi:serine/threonine protein kinase